MQSTATQLKHKTYLIKPTYLFLFLLSIADALLTYKNILILRSTSRHDTQLAVLNISIAIPELIIWIGAFIGSLRLKQYARNIKSSRDGASMAYLADALVLMAVYVVLLTSASNTVNLFKNSKNLHTIVSIENYLPLGAVLASSILLFLAAGKLNEIVPLRIGRASRYMYMAIFIAASIFFAWHFDKTEAKLMPQNGVPRFVLSTRVLMFTYVLPQIITWAFGLYACLSIANYSFYTKGAIYKSLFSSLYKGVLMVFVAIFLSQLLILSNVSLSKFSIYSVMIYALLALGALGFTLIYRGSSRLNRLERV